jgi:hypothetical protein
MHDDVSHPKHYTQHPSGVECIEITEHLNFCLGNAIKYVWRAGLKGEDPVQDLQKAVWYIEREIDRLQREDINWDEMDKIIERARHAMRDPDQVDDEDEEIEFDDEDDEDDEQTTDGEWVVMIAEDDDDNLEILISK